jgi:hypothetical protein
VYSITQWPGEENRNQPKTPTVIKYNSSSAQTFRWGYELDQVEDKISSLKLLLDPEQPHPYDIMTDVDAEIAKLPKRVLDIASDYMKAIYEHAVSVIQQDSMDPTFLDQYQKVYVLTVPAVWSDKAKSLTLQVKRSFHAALSYRRLC